MKQLLTILLLSVHLFYTGGYQLVFDQLEQHTGDQMVQRIDAEVYSEKDLVEVKVPVNLPYQTSWSDYERYDGEIFMNGVHYNYVKRKLQNDTLILLCLPNTEKTRVLNARETFFSLVNDLQQEPTSKQSSAPLKPIKFSQVECLVTQAFSITAIAPGVHSQRIGNNASPLTDRPVRSPEQPPETPGV